MPNGGASGILQRIGDTITREDRKPRMAPEFLNRHLSQWWAILRGILNQYQGEGGENVKAEAAEED